MGRMVRDGIDTTERRFARRVYSATVVAGGVLYAETGKRTLYGCSVP
jgi:hypothetical protein